MNQSVRKAGTGTGHEGNLSAGLGVAVGHGGENTLLQGQNHLHVGTVEQGIEYGIVPCRRVEEDKADSALLELLDENFSGGALHHRNRAFAGGGDAGSSSRRSKEFHILTSGCGCKPRGRQAAEKGTSPDVS